MERLTVLDLLPNFDSLSPENQALFQKIVDNFNLLLDSTDHPPTILLALPRNGRDELLQETAERWHRKIETRLPRRRKTRKSARSSH